MTQRLQILVLTLTWLAAFNSALAGQSGAPSGQAATDEDRPPRLYEKVVVTASAREERLGETGTTMQVLDRDTIEASPAASVTALLAERGVAFFGQWSPSQTAINMRGATTDGQGRDFRSQVVVLINGRRAGTANVSKLSLHEVERIEIVRGPGSLLYGSQAIGGVVNIITRSGLAGASRSLELNAGSWGQIDSAGLIAGTRGKIDYAIGVHGGRRGDYESGDNSGEPMTNTSYSQRGGLLELGYSASARERFSFTVRTDGIYNAGFRGSQWDIDNHDSRYNESGEASYSRSSSTGHVAFTGRYYFFRDVDDFRWGTEVVRQGNGLPGPGFDRDDNNRVNSGHGLKAMTTLTPWTKATTLVGLDGEWSRLRNRRDRSPVPGGATTQTAPFDNNSNARNTGILAEHVQKFGADRVTARGGVRFDFGDQAVKATPNQPLLQEKSAPYDSVTYRATIAIRLRPEWSVRGGVGTGFRAPTASELTADYTTVQGGQILGNPDLRPERTTSVDVGTLLEHGPMSLDIDLFRNRIRDRIATVAVTQNRTQFVNRGTSDITGVEVQSRTELGTFGSPLRFWAGANGFYHFVMRDNDAIARGLNSNRIDRMSQYQGSVEFGGRADGGWNLRLAGILSGPMWYDTEENLLIPEAEPTRTFVHRKDPFWLWNMNASHPIGAGVEVRASVTNLFNANVHPTFISVNKLPFLSDSRFSNGGHGNSLPGRGISVGVRWKR